MGLRNSDAVFFQKTRRRIMRAEGHLRQLEKMTAWEARQTILARERCGEPGRLLRHGYRVYSQTDEDGIIAEILRRIGAPDRTFLEIGAGDGQENNTLNLLVQGWRGAWVEADPGRYHVIEDRLAEALTDGRLRLARARITPETAGSMVAELTGGKPPDLLSLDIDGNDYHVLKALDGLRSRVVVLEYNPKFRPPTVWIMKYDPSHAWNGSDHYGASLSAYTGMLAAKGYSLVACGITGNNAFFVRDDLLAGHFRPPYTAENHYEPARFWLTPGFESGHPADFRG